MDATVIVCTRNRAGLVAGCLASLAEQTISDFDIVVVDNGSTDGTARLLTSWTEHEPARRRVVTEPTPGLSRARNAGLAVTQADVVLFIDDDAVAPPGWAAAHLASYQQAAAPAAAGGPVVLDWAGPRPQWLGSRLEHWFSALDHGDQPGPFPPPHGPYGTNMSARREVLSGVGGFAESLGRRGRSLISSEEADLWQRLWDRGHSIAYEPATVVVHRVPRRRSRRRWVLRRGWAQGRTNARRRVLHQQLAWPEVVAVCRDEATMAARLVRSAARRAARRDQPAVIDDVARAAGHLAAVIEQVSLHARGGSRA